MKTLLTYLIAAPFVLALVWLAWQMCRSGSEFKKAARR